MRKKRTKKRGYVYILESADKLFVKYGASTDVKTRIRHINYKYKDNKFSLVKAFPSKDMYRHECMLKWELWHFGILSEVFICAEDVGLKELLSLAEETLNREPVK